MKKRFWILLFSAALAADYANSAIAEHLTVNAVKHELAAATPEQPADFSGQNLTGLDLSGLNLTGANLAGANLSNARLVHTNLTGANLSGATLVGVWLIGANFTRANLSRTHLLSPVVAHGLKTSTKQSPVFAGADFRGARVIANLSNGRDAGTNFSHAILAADMSNQSMGLMRFEAEGTDLRNADFSHAKLGHASFKFANLTGANFRHADIRNAEFDGADLSGAQFAGARAKGASFTDAKLDGATGMKQAHHMNIANARELTR